MTKSYEDFPIFNEWLDTRHEEVKGPLSVFGTSVRPSEVLFRLVRDTYEAAYADYLSDKLDELRESVFADYPAPIAYHFYRFENGYEDETQRLHFLRSTWEALINVTHALVVCEARFRSLDLQTSEAKLGNLLSDRLSQRLQNVQHILSFAADNDLELAVRHIVPEEAIKTMARLNQTRNAFSHSEAVSVEQARQYVAECYDEVLGVLESLSGLKAVSFIRYMSQEGLNIRYEAFDGHAMTRTIKSSSITQQQFGESHTYFADPQILVQHEVQHEGAIFGLKPFFHFQSAASGHETRLCCLKKCHGDHPDRMLSFEILGEAREADLTRSDFQADIDGLRALFGLDAEATS